MTQTDMTGQLSWLLDNLVTQVEHVQQALVLSRDGLLVAASHGLTAEDGEHIVVESTGLFTKGSEARKHIRGPVRKVIISAPATDPDCTLVLGNNPVDS